MMQMFFATRKLACGVAPTIAAALFMLVPPWIALDTAGFCDSFADVARKTQTGISLGMRVVASNFPRPIAAATRSSPQPRC
jgi:hypothetical protein